MPKPVCVPCQRFYRPKRNGFVWVESTAMAEHAEPGRDHPEHWSPYQLWQGDLYECPGCHAQIVVGHGLRPLAYQHDTDFAEQVASFEARLIVNDH